MKFNRLNSRFTRLSFPTGLANQLECLYKIEEEGINEKKTGVFFEYGWSLESITEKGSNRVSEIEVIFTSKVGGRISFKIMARKFASLPQSIGFDAKDLFTFAGWLYDYILEEIAFCDPDEQGTIIL